MAAAESVTAPTRALASAFRFEMAGRKRLTVRSLAITPARMDMSAKATSIQRPPSTLPRHVTGTRSP